MRATMMLTGLVLVGAALFPRPVEGQYPFLDPEDPCFSVIMDECDIPMPINQAAAWSDADLLAAYALQFRDAMDDFADAGIWILGEGIRDNAAELKEYAESLDRILDCLPTLEQILIRIDDRLEELGVDTVVDASGRSHERISRQDLIRGVNQRLMEIQKKARDLRNRIGRLSVGPVERGPD